VTRSARLAVYSDGAVLQQGLKVLESGRLSRCEGERRGLFWRNAVEHINFLGTVAVVSNPPRR